MMLERVEKPDAMAMISGGDTKQPATLGWGVAAAKPGKYFLRSMITSAPRTPGVTRPKVKGEIMDLLGQTVEVKAGEVVYIGTMIYKTGAGKNSFGNKDESGAAKAWMQRHLPKLAGALKTRLLDCGCDAKKDPAKYTKKILKNLDKLIKAAAEAKNKKKSTAATQTKPANSKKEAASQ